VSEAPHQPDEPASEQTSRRSGWRQQLRRWPGKVAAAIGAAFLAWFVSFVGPKLFNSAATKVGGVKSPVSIVVIDDVAHFTSLADASSGPPVFVFSGKIASLGAPPDRGNPERSEERWAWAHEHGAVDALDSLVRLKISGTSSTPVILDDLRIKVTQRQPPLDGWELTYLGLGSAQGTRYFDINLDKPSPSVRYAGKRDPFPLRVSADDIEVIDLLASTQKCDCSWTAQLDWAAGDKQGTTTITDHGRPFRTTAVLTNSEGWSPHGVIWQGGRWRTESKTGAPGPPAHD
jgi:hypothetical protein